MSILNIIKAEQLLARKSKDTLAANLLTTLMSDIVMVGKNSGNRESTDAEAIAIIKKYIVNVNETLKIVNSESDKVVSLLTELSILEAFLPKQLSETELRLILETFKQNNVQFSIPNVMKYLKSSFAGLYDGSSATKIIKEML